MSCSSETKRTQTDGSRARKSCSSASCISSGPNSFSTEAFWSVCNCKACFVSGVQFSCLSDAGCWAISFRHRVLSLLAQIHWPPRLPDISSQDFFSLESAEGVSLPHETSLKCETEGRDCWGGSSCWWGLQTSCDGKPCEETSGVRWKYGGYSWCYLKN